MGNDASVPRGGAHAVSPSSGPHVGVSGEQVPCCLASTGRPAQPQPPSGVLCCGGTRPRDKRGGRTARLRLIPP